MSTSGDCELEINLERPQPEAFRVELHFNEPSSDAIGQSASAYVRFDLDLLDSQKRNTSLYGESLSAMLFADAGLQQFFENCKVRVGSNKLRVRLIIDGTAAELHGLRWELLRDPATQRMLSTSEQFLFSRFMQTRDWRPVKLRPKGNLRALIVVASPSNLSAYGMAEIDKQREFAAASAALAGIPVELLGQNEPVTLPALIAAIRRGCDIVYLVCHGSYPESGEPKLFLQKENGEMRTHNGSELASAIGDIAEPPKLLVLASCESAGADGRAAESALAPRLAEAGIPSIIAMQAKVSMRSVAIAMPILFQELQIDGRIDRAMAVARAAIRAESDCWVPALFSRLKSGRFWFQPSFGAGGNDDLPWDSVCFAVVNRQAVAILGPDLAEHVMGTSTELAAALARDAHIPLPPGQRPDSARIAQTIRTNSGSAALHSAILQKVQYKLLETARRLSKDLSEETLAEMSPPELQQWIVDELYKDPDDPFHIISTLNINVFVSAAMDSFLKLFLKKAGKNPVEMFSDWSGRGSKDDELVRLKAAATDLYRRFEQTPGADPFELCDEWRAAMLHPQDESDLPVSLQAAADALLERLLENPDAEPLRVVADWRETVQNPPVDTKAKPWPVETPVLHYVFGKFRYEKTCVLTENDFFDYLLRFTSHRLMPTIVAERLVVGSLLFLGFSLDDWKFRVLFRMMMSQEGKNLLNNPQYHHIGVQVDPEEYSPDDAPRIRTLLVKYFGNETKISIYWGSSATFLRELRTRLQDPKYKVAPVKQTTKRQGNNWP